MPTADVMLRFEIFAADQFQVEHRVDLIVEAIEATGFVKGEVDAHSTSDFETPDTEGVTR